MMVPCAQDPCSSKPRMRGFQSEVAHERLQRRDAVIQQIDAGLVEVDGLFQEIVEQADQLHWTTPSSFSQIT